MIKINQAIAAHACALLMAGLLAGGAAMPLNAQARTPAVTSVEPAPVIPPLRASFILDASVQETGGAVRLTPDDSYDEGKGYGFTSTRDGNEQALALRVPPGDYRVRVTLGSKAAASRTAIWAEDRRLMLAPVVLKKGETKIVEFIVNVRNPAVVSSEQDAAGKAPQVGLRGDEATQSRNWDDRLTIAFSGAAPAVQRVDITGAAARRVLIAGDSTVSDQGGGDYASWGQMLPRFLAKDVSVANHARSGETMKSFVTSLRWGKLLSDLRAGDVVLIQFGHNDQKKQWPRTYVDAEQAYPAWLKALASDVQARGARVVLISSVSRRTFENGKITNSLAGYDTAVARVAREMNVPFIDLTARTKTLYEALGPEISPLAFGQEGADKTHHNAYGAYLIANYVAQGLVDPAAGLDLKPAADFRSFDPAKPADPTAYDLIPSDWPLMREVVGGISGN